MWICSLGSIRPSTILLLRGAAIVGGAPGRRRRLVGAAAAGGLYAVAAVLPGAAAVRSVPGQIAAAVAMVILAFGWRRSSVKQGLYFFGLELCAQRRGAAGGAVCGAGPQAAGRQSLLRCHHAGLITFGRHQLRLGCAGTLGERGGTPAAISPPSPWDLGTGR